MLLPNIYFLGELHALRRKFLWLVCHMEEFPCLIEVSTWFESTHWRSYSDANEDCIWLHIDYLSSGKDYLAASRDYLASGRDYLVSGRDYLAAG